MNTPILYCYNINIWIFDVSVFNVIKNNFQNHVFFGFWDLTNNPCMYLNIDQQYVH